MILQTLSDYYNRKMASESGSLAPSGFEWKEIPFVFVLDETGTLVQIDDTREGEGKKKRARRFLVPQGVKRSSGVLANLLWDNPEYSLGIPLKSAPERVQKQHAAFRERLKSLQNQVEDAGLHSLVRFLSGFGPANLDRFPTEWEEIRTTGPFLGFRLAGDSDLINNRSDVRAAIAGNTDGESSGNEVICLVSGKRDEVAVCHPAIKGVAGAQSSGGNVVSFNLSSGCSFGKEQGYNAPVGKSGAFAYTTALNHLLNKDSKQKMLVGDMTMVFWAEKAHELESAVADFFGEPPKDDPDRNVRAIESLFKSPWIGADPTHDDQTRFFVLGLSPNAARISVRFWTMSTVGELARHIKEHFNDLELVRGPFDKPFLSIFRLLVNVASLNKTENIPPNLAGEMIRSVLDGRRYPSTLLQAAVRRIRADHTLSFPRVSLIKACLNRDARLFQKPKEELHVSLDEANENVGYRLGRLFAVLEKIQGEASPSLNATIRDRFYGAGSGTPVTVFPILMRLKNHHLGKLENRGRVVFFEKLIGTIMSAISEFPAHLVLPDQGRFAVGYYHQQQDFYRKADPATQA